MCPLSITTDIGSTCKYKECWLNHARAKNHCMALDSGSTDITKFDVARVYGVKPKAAQSIIDAGREKLTIWLKLISATEDIQQVLACERCGAVECRGGEMCGRGEAVIDALSKRIPLNDAIEMSAYRWVVLINKHGALLREVAKLLER